jgi:hypothetical protein
VPPGSYRVERHFAKEGNDKYFLVKDLRVGGKNAKVRKFIGSGKLLFLGKDRPQYIKALRLGNEERYAEMVPIFADMIIGQRLNILNENFMRVMTAESRGQRRLLDFIST